MEVPDGLFKNIKYYLIGTIDDQITELLTAGGAKRDHYLSEMVTYAIADDASEPDYMEAKELFELPVVTSRWVILSVKCGALLPINAFSPDPSQIFSDVVACPSQLTAGDGRTVWALVTFHGGRCQLNLDSKVTHLITVKPSGSKYNCAMRHADKVKIVTPDWILKCAAEKTKIDETRYHPRLLVFEEEKKPEPVKSPPRPVSPMDTLVHPQQLLTFAGQLSAQSLSSMTQAPIAMTTSMPLPMSHIDASKSEMSRTKEALARMVNQRLDSNREGGGQIPPLPLRPPTSAPVGVPRQASPRNTLRNITNNGDSRSPRSPRSPARKQKISQLVSNLNRTPKQMSPQHRMGARQLSSATGDIPMYFAHDPTETIPSDLCLLGCVFYIADYQKYLEASLLNTWKQVVEQHGGHIDESYSNRVTHVLCEHQKSDVFQLALRDGKRLVTAHWLNDCLNSKKMAVPWLALHFPSPYAKEKPCGNQIICVTNFEGDERIRIKHMISSVGAKYTGYMTRANSVVLATRPGGKKYVRALEWRIPIVNVQWLSEIVLGDLNALKLPVHSRFQNFNSANPFNIELWRVSHLLDGWKVPVRVSKETWKKFHPSHLLKRSLGNKGSPGSSPGGVGAGMISEIKVEMGEKRKAESDLEREQQGKKFRPAEREVVRPPQLNGLPIILMTSLPRDRAQQLGREIVKLGGYVAESADNCSHLVASYVARTVKFLTAIGRVKHIVSPTWIEACVREHKFLDEAPYTLKDVKAELNYNFNLEESLARAKTKPLFQEFVFYITPGIVPSSKTLTEMITSAGGRTVAKRPSVAVIRRQRTSQGDPAFIVISCTSDLYLCRDLKSRNMPVHNAEFILTGILKQEVDYQSYRLGWS
ncbi:PAX-interacting protein 1 [Lamellibrachia satsuma]|nr:PAX-interacting protein 1 [Lamellibrachia satsuma]